MTLTKKDLNAIQNIVEDVVEEKLEKKLDQKLKPIKKDITYLKKSINLIIKRYDPMVIDHVKRLDRVEDVWV